MKILMENGICKVQSILMKKELLSWFLDLTLIWVGLGALELRFAEGGGSKSHTRLNLVRIILEIWKFVREYTDLCSFRKYTFLYQDPLNFANVSIFLQKNQHFFGKIVPLPKVIVWEYKVSSRAPLKLYVLIA